MSAKKECNLAVVLHGVNDLRLEEKSIQEPGEGEVLLLMYCVGICGSDVHYWTHGSMGSFIVKKPLVLGHEGSGVVCKVGKNVHHLQAGDRVAIEPTVGCSICNYCKEGNYNLCPKITCSATPPDDGNLCRFYKHAADFCHKLPDHVSLEEGALLEPLSVAVHACRRAGITIGSTVLITGAGPIGLLNLITAKAMGASKVIVTDIVGYKLENAKRLGADSIYLIKKDEAVEQVAVKIRELFDGDAPKKTLDCSGVEYTIQLGMEVTRHGGTLVIVGLAAPNEVTVPLLNTMFKEVDIRGVCRYCNDYPIALAMVASGILNVKQIITHQYVLEDALKAFETARTSADNAIKVMIYCEEGLKLS